MTKRIFFALLGFFSFFNTFGQQDVFNRSDSNTGEFGSGNLPWFYQTSNNNQGDPDNNNTVSNKIINHENVNIKISTQKQASRRSHF